jgi:hypothetical protein
MVQGLLSIRLDALKENARRSIRRTAFAQIGTSPSVTELASSSNGVIGVCRMSERSKMPLPTSVLPPTKPCRQSFRVNHEVKRVPPSTRDRCRPHCAPLELYMLIVLTAYSFVWRTTVGSAKERGQIRQLQLPCEAFCGTRADWCVTSL